MEAYICASGSARKKAVNHFHFHVGAANAKTPQYISNGRASRRLGQEHCRFVCFGDRALVVAA